MPAVICSVVAEENRDCLHFVNKFECIYMKAGKEVRISC